MQDASIEEANSDIVESQIHTFEVNAQLWRLEATRFAESLSEETAFGAKPGSSVRTDALVAIDRIEMEIGRFQTLSVSQKGAALPKLVRLAEVAVTLQSARRRLAGALALS